MPRNPNRPQDRGPGQTRSGKDSNYDIVRLKTTDPESIQNYIASYGHLRNAPIYVTAYGRKRVQSPPDSPVGEPGHLALIPSRIGRALASGRYNSEIQSGLDQFIDVDYVDLHIRR